MKLRIAKKVVYFRGALVRTGTHLRARRRWLRWMGRLISRVIKGDVQEARRAALLGFKLSLDALRDHR